MYNIILALVLTCSLGGVVFLLSRKRGVIQAESAIEKEAIISADNSIANHLPKVTILFSNLKVRRESLENITEKSLRRLRVFVLRVDNRLVNSIGKLKEDKISPFVDNGKIQALINAPTVAIVSQVPLIVGQESIPIKTETEIWSLEKNYRNVLASNFDIETLSKLTDLYLDLGDFSTLRGTLLQAINSDLSWDDIMSKPKLVECFKILTEKDSLVTKKIKNIRNGMSPNVHQRKKKLD